jgi:predicted MFS family arabinose efflux permease
MQFAKVSVLFDALERHYQASPALIGWLVSTVGLVGVVFGASAGLVVARFGSRATLVVALTAGAAISLIEATLPSLSLMLGLRTLEGASHLAIVVSAPSCLVALTAPGERPLTLPEATQRALRGADVKLGIVAQHLEIYANARTATPALCFMSYTGMYVALQTLTPELAPPESRTALIVGMAIVSIVASLAAGALAHRGWSPFSMTIGAFAMTIVSSVILQFAVATAIGIAPAALFRMVFVSLLPGSILPMLPRLNPDAASQARAFGALAQTGNVGSVLGPPLFAASAEVMGPIGLLLPAVALCVGGAGMARWAGRRFSGAT